MGRGLAEIHSAEVGEGNEGGTGISEGCRLVKGKVVGGDASKCRATCAARGGRWGLVIYDCSFNHRRSGRRQPSQARVNLQQGLVDVSGRLHLLKAKERCGTMCYY